jgi:glycine/D-amino acid oxidase-like deaminating enzyme
VVDVAVVGGGVVGSSVAYHAARAGLTVVLVDREDAGHATAAGAGIIAFGLWDQPGTVRYALMAATAAFYPQFVASLAADGETETGYAVVGALLVALTAAEAEHLATVHGVAQQSSADGMQGIGEIALLDAVGAQALFPALGAVQGALHLGGTARMDGRLLRAALQRAAQRHGASLRRGDAVLGKDGSGRAVVIVDGKPIPVDQVVLAAGAWSRQVAQGLGVTIPVYPQRGQIAHLALPGSETSRWPVILTFREHYLLTFPPDRVVVGATRENDSGFDYRLTAGGVQQVLGQALGVAPGLSGATLQEVRIGFRPATADGLPILGRVPGVENAYVATGHGPSGLTLGPHAGALIVDLLRGATPDLDLAPYALDRFAGRQAPASVQPEGSRPGLA